MHVDQGESYDRECDVCVCMIVSGVRSGNNAVSVVSAATVIGVGGDVGGVRDGGERIHVDDV